MLSTPFLRFEQFATFHAVVPCRQLLEPTLRIWALDGKLAAAGIALGPEESGFPALRARELQPLPTPGTDIKPRVYSGPTLRAFHGPIRICPGAVRTYG